MRETNRIVSEKNIGNNHNLIGIIIFYNFFLDYKCLIYFKCLAKGEKAAKMSENMQKNLNIFNYFMKMKYLPQ